MSERLHACGDVGLLGEEAVQRLLLIFSESANACLHQIKSMLTSHNQKDELFAVGLDLVSKWDKELVQEEITRMELNYPELTQLHSFAFLWLVERLCPEDKLPHICTPEVSEIYSKFMQKVVQHYDVRKGVKFIDYPDVYKRIIYSDSLRNTYHDIFRKVLDSTQRIIIPKETKEIPIADDAFYDKDLVAVSQPSKTLPIPEDVP